MSTCASREFVGQLAQLIAPISSSCVLLTGWLVVRPVCLSVGYSIEHPEVSMEYKGDGRREKDSDTGMEIEIETKQTSG